MAGLFCGSPVRQRAGALPLVLAAVALGAVVGIAVGGCSGPVPRPVPSARDERWQRDIAYLARELPAVRAAGLGGVTSPAWSAAAARLEGAVPGLTDGQVVVRLAQMVAMLHDDETTRAHLSIPSVPDGCGSRWPGLRSRSPRHGVRGA